MGKECLGPLSVLYWIVVFARSRVQVSARDHTRLLSPTMRNTKVLLRARSHGMDRARGKLACARDVEHSWMVVAQTYIVYPCTNKPTQTQNSASEQTMNKMARFTSELYTYIHIYIHMSTLSALGKCFSPLKAVQF